jgi:hypothetical protein
VVKNICCRCGRRTRLPLCERCVGALDAQKQRYALEVPLVARSARRRVSRKLKSGGFLQVTR